MLSIGERRILANPRSMEHREDYRELVEAERTLKIRTKPKDSDTESGDQEDTDDEAENAGEQGIE